MGNDDIPAPVSERTPIINVPRRLPARQHKQGPPKHLGGANTSVMSFLAACGTMLSMFLVMTRFGPKLSNKDLAALSSSSSESTVVFERTSDGVDVAWQRPPASIAPRGTFFLAHGCSHRATDFFPRSERCARCMGLPEELAVVDKALARGYAVVAVSSVGRCWSIEDGLRVKSAIDFVLGKKGNTALAGKPVFAFGASSGGAFVGTLPFITPVVDGIISQISSVRLPKLTDKASLSQELRARGGRDNFPPTVFSHMSRDEVTSKLVDGAKTYLEGMDVPVRVTKLKPLPIDENFFSERVRVRGRREAAGGADGDDNGTAGDEGYADKEGIDAETSTKMVAALRGAGLLDPSGYLKEDPRSSDWRQTLAPMANSDSLRPDESPLSEVLNVAYALHELSADGFEDDVAWLEKMHGEATKTNANKATATVGSVVGGGGQTGGAGVVPPRRAVAGVGAGA